MLQPMSSKRRHKGEGVTFQGFCSSGSDTLSIKMTGLVKSISDEQGMQHQRYAGKTNLQQGHAEKLTCTNIYAEKSGCIKVRRNKREKKYMYAERVHGQ